jgi:hypothetical protein
MVSVSPHQAELKASQLFVVIHALFVLTRMDFDPLASVVVLVGLGNKAGVDLHYQFVQQFSQFLAQIYYKKLV